MSPMKFSQYAFLLVLLAGGVFLVAPALGSYPSASTAEAAPACVLTSPAGTAKPVPLAKPGAPASGSRTLAGTVGTDPHVEHGAPAAAADKPVPCVWLSVAPIIDGADSDWGSAAFVDAEDGNIGCAFANDAKNLYILFVIKNPQYKSTIEQTGVTMYFNAEGKKKTGYGILFNKIMIKPDEYIAMVEKQSPLTDEQKTQIRSKPGYYLYHHEVLGKKKADVASPEGPVQSAVYKYAAKGGMLVYEFLVPLVRANENLAGVGVEAGKTVMVGIEYGGMTEEMRKARNRQTGEAGIANEQMTQEAMRNNIIGSTGGKTPKKYTFWTEIQLAQEAK